MNFNKFCQDYNLETAPPDHKHYQEGWTNVECPLCTGNAGYHLGYEEDTDRFHCWRCGPHKHVEAIAGLLKTGNGEAARLWKRYSSKRPRRIHRKPKVIERQIKVSLPPGTQTMKKRHRRYLRSRGFDPDRLEETWGLLGTGPFGPYKFRIVAPITFEGKLVSYQGRDITNRQRLRYKACPMEKEARHHKACLYGLDQVPGETVVIVEGITDVWRLGVGSVATFGIKYTKTQVLLLKRFKRRAILFDSADSQAQEQAEKLAKELSAFSGETISLIIDAKDPGTMSPKDAQDLMRQLGINTVGVRL